MSAPLVIPASSEMLLAKLATDAGRAYQENVRLYGEFTAKSMHEQSNRGISAVAELLQDVRSVVATGDERTLRLAIENLRKSYSKCAGAL